MVHCVETLNSEVIYTRVTRRRQVSNSSVVNVHAASKRKTTENAMKRPAAGLELRFRNGMYVLYVV